MTHYVYILQSEARGSYYVGQTDNLEKRLSSHNRGQVRSTKGRRPWKLTYFECHASRSEAVVREREIKSRKKRRYIESLIHTERSAAR